MKKKTPLTKKPTKRTRAIKTHLSDESVKMIYDLSRQDPIFAQPTGGPFMVSGWFSNELPPAKRKAWLGRFIYACVYKTYLWFLSRGYGA